MRGPSLQGHQIFVQQDVATGIGFSDDDYRRADATILATPAEISAASEVIVKVKEPQPGEIALLSG